MGAPIGLDTNVLIRLLVDDDKKQAEAVRDFLSTLSGERQGFVSTVTLVEVYWVLKSRYGIAKDDIVNSFMALLEVRELCFQDSPALYGALEACRNGADFADALIVALSKEKGCEQTVTFDKDAASKSGMTLLS